MYKDSAGPEFRDSTHTISKFHFFRTESESAHEGHEDTSRELLEIVDKLIGEVND
jgi:hypothetical protein